MRICAQQITIARNSLVPCMRPDREHRVRTVSLTARGWGRQEEGTIHEQGGHPGGGISPLPSWADFGNLFFVLIVVFIFSGGGLVQSIRFEMLVSKEGCLHCNSTQQAIASYIPSAKFHTQLVLVGTAS